MCTKNFIWKYFLLTLFLHILAEIKKTATDAISFNDFSFTETGPYENPPFFPAFFVLKALVNETEIAKFVSITSQCRFSKAEHHLRKFWSVLATNHSNWSLFTIIMFIGRCWAYDTSITTSNPNTSYGTSFDSIAYARCIRLLEWSDLYYFIVRIYFFHWILHKSSVIFTNEAKWKIISNLQHR